MDRRSCAPVRRPQPLKEQILEAFVCLCAFVAVGLALIAVIRDA